MNGHRSTDSSVIWITLLVAVVCVAAIAGAAGWLMAKQRFAAEMQAREAQLMAQEHALRLQAEKETARAQEEAARQAHAAGLRAADAARETPQEPVGNASEENGAESDPRNPEE